MRRCAVIAVISSLLLAGLLVFSYTKASPSAAARLQVSSEPPRQDKGAPASYGRFQAPSVLAPSSL